MTTKFTPGPYDIGKYSAKYTYPGAVDYEFDAMSIGDENSIQRAIIPMDGPDWERHMHLISAAPDLLEALQELFVLGDVYSSAIESTGPNIDLEAWEVKAKAAIAKALGEQ